MRSVQPFRPGGEVIFRRRLLIGLGVLVVVALLAGLGARLAGGGSARTPAATASTSGTSAPASPSPALPSPSGTASAPAGVAKPLHTTSPTAYAKAFARALWSYDTRTTTQPQYLAALHAWLTPEKQYADPASIDAQVPTALLWEQMRDQQQYATAKVSEAHLPAAFQEAIAENPTALTTAYIYAVTVNGTQSIAWSGNGRGAQASAVTLAVQCRPSQDCTLASIASTVYP